MLNWMFILGSGECLIFYGESRPCYFYFEKYIRIGIIYSDLLRFEINYLIFIVMNDTIEYRIHI